MIESVEIERLRGIRRGRVDGLAPLTVLVGQNGSGKSTVLDALLIGCSRDIGSAVVQAVQRRSHVDFATPWLFWRAGRDKSWAKISVDPVAKDAATVLGYESDDGIDTVNIGLDFLSEDPALKPQHARLRARMGNARGSVTLGAKNVVSETSEITRKTSLTVSLIEATHGERLDRLLTIAIQAGRRRAVESLLAEVIPGLVSVLMLTDKAGNPEVHFEYEWGSVPVALAGDGLRALTRLVYALATPKDALLLVEEPEVHMHPRALDAAARAMVATVGRGNQVVVSTHSLDLIDDLIRAADAAGKLDDFAVFRTAIVDGELRTSRFPGDEAKFARDQIEEDLR